MKRILVASLLFITGCSEEPPLLSVSVDYARADGTVFIARNDQAGVTCGAGFLNTVHTRSAANQLDLEVWCGSGDLLGSLKFKDVGRAEGDRARSTIANIRGRLFDYERSAIRRSWGWYSDDGVLGIPGRVKWYQETPSGPFAVVWGYEDCKGLSIVSGDAYYGSFDGRASAMSFFQGKLIANLDYKIVEFPLSHPVPPCTNIEARILDPERHWDYGMFPFANHLIIGGTIRDETNARLYEYDGGRLTSSMLPTQDRIATEYYSYMQYYDHLLIGTYPSGNLVKISKDLSIEVTDSPPALAEPSSEYREAQSMTLLKGTLLVGMYPWGALYQQNDAGEWSSRLIMPEVRGTGAVVPFQDGYERRFANLHPTAETRERGLDYNSWALRITSLAVFDGKLCFGTGTMSDDVVYQEEVHTHVPAKIGEKYGDVFCSDVSNHGLIQFDDQTPGKVTIQLYRDHLVVVKDGREIKDVDLSDDMAARLASGSFDVTLGYGPYGQLATQ